MSQNSANLINQTSGEFEYYTPPLWPNLARELMGQIDLDPASNEIANKTIQATAIFTQQTDGLSQNWFGNVWMNHPFHRGEQPCPKNRDKCKKKACVKRGYHIDEPIPSNEDWINKIVSEYQNGYIKQAVMICFCSSSETWFKPLLQYPQLFPNGRVHYHKADGSKADNCTKGSVITYLGPDLDGFIKIFGPHGTIKIEVN
ncbi:hypothetical protein K6Y31_20570 [Motilimonas cestriensis]|uniref:Uncharacterized protein n=1 Tax=Motilimonas cestriensis TaxID=2742685 RepID=A0ABS8WDQ0_9GAMM|nr:hypothetical protein [Motilimonas cestriensis]MCE2597172.1 hypothetical protein [Motilimonas cestriensis]